MIRCLYRAFQAWQKDHAPRMSAALAYYTIFFVSAAIDYCHCGR
jgi:uncharacterized BrkB/YihY/UPF0761 family membrane protein